jgi:phage-related protein
MAVYDLPVGWEDRWALSASYTSEGRNRVVEFGDGYTQRTPLGLNALVRNLEISFDNLTTTERNEIMAFLAFIQAGGDAIALYPNELLPYPGKFFVTSMNVGLADNNRVNINVSLREVFDL